MAGAAVVALVASATGLFAAPAQACSCAGPFFPQLAFEGEVTSVERLGDGGTERWHFEGVEVGRGILRERSVDLLVHTFGSAGCGLTIHGQPGGRYRVDTDHLPVGYEGLHPVGLCFGSVQELAAGETTFRPVRMEDGKAGLAAMVWAAGLFAGLLGLAVVIRGNSGVAD